jgi:hypothetical protein
MIEQFPHDPNDEHFIDLILEDRYKEELEMYRRLEAYLGSRQAISDWMFQHINAPPFNGQIPAVTLIRQPYEVYNYVKELTEGYV